MKKSEARLIVWGCLPKINPEALKEIYSGPLIGPEEAGDFFSRLFSLPEKKNFDSFSKKVKPQCIPRHEHNSQPQAGKLLDLLDHALFKSRRVFHFGRNRTNKQMLYIKIVRGCKNNCTYCSDRLVYKTVKSVPIENIIEQFKFGLDKGYRKFFLVGRDLGSYGEDTGTNLALLLKKILESTHQADYKITLVNVSPNSLIELYPKLEQIFASDKIAYLGSHIQSGSPRILKLMGKKFHYANGLT